LAIVRWEDTRIGIWEDANSEKQNLMEGKQVVTSRNQLDQHEARWFAVYTKYKREKQVFKRLQERGIEAYLPLQAFTRRYTRKVKHVELPLISCYIFTKITKPEYVPVLETPDVVNFVRIAKDLIAIPEVEMELMKRVVGEGQEISVNPNSYEPGDEVEVIGGSLTGLRGKLVEKQDEKNFVIELENLGYEMRMFVNPAWLRRTGKRIAKPETQASAAPNWGLSL